ncbi:hypothetical protein SNEBB_007618 [Seison nebaliae]|nr:hypothetical protein SNEBB_007618 [Seison nebaliae]
MTSSTNNLRNSFLKFSRTSTGALNRSSTPAVTSGTIDYEGENKINRQPPDQRLQYIKSLNPIKVVGVGTFGWVRILRNSSTNEFFALKSMSISYVMKGKEQEHVKNEKKILSIVKHPFIVKLKMTAHDRMYIYMLMEFCNGGELFSHLRKATNQRFTNSDAIFFAAEITAAFEFLHRYHIVYRDLKPENILLDSQGHIRLTDFGFAKIVDDRTWTLCGTPEYLAPEIIRNHGHNKAVDWWTLGVLIYEMLIGQSPFDDKSKIQMYENIVAGKYSWPFTVDTNAKDIVKKLLTIDVTRRLGAMRGGAEDVKKHKWFKGINWNDVYSKRLKPPIVPQVTHNGDSRCFDEFPENHDTDQSIPATPHELEFFRNF